MNSTAFGELGQLLDQLQAFAPMLEIVVEAVRQIEHAGVAIAAPPFGMDRVTLDLRAEIRVAHAAFEIAQIAEAQIDIDRILGDPVLRRRGR